MDASSTRAAPTLTFSPARGPALRGDPGSPRSAFALPKDEAFESRARQLERPIARASEHALRWRQPRAVTIRDVGPEGRERDQTIDPSSARADPTAPAAV